ncbi:uncharacterized protein K02A2.6-like [Neodiprion virginianus]|uniref:uncharacterized protein K02A2.6-like n=1 Tax=Neodiprion virginianus TaxID=2961670 RepID=UPI001EE7800E|nr:uncharacterized protein K02A2.6-like [Neodiprion virginianus]
MKAIANGWTSNPKTEVIEYFRKRQDNLSTVDNTLLMGDRVVIPKTMQPEILTARHKGHPGIRKMKQLAREYVYWPKILENIKRLVQQCDAYALTRRMPIKVPLSLWPEATRPLERLYIDIGYPPNSQYLYIFVDVYSKFLEVAIASSITATHTGELCHEVFSRYGPPEMLVSDHGSQFTSGLFANLSENHQITHLISPVNHPQSNGQAERVVDTVKTAIAKDATNWKKTLFGFLHSYRYTPCEAAPGGKSPAELFFGQQMNTPFSKLFPKPKEEKSGPDDFEGKKTNMKNSLTDIMAHDHVNSQSATAS